jgi:hypothetical protein
MSAAISVNSASNGVIRELAEDLREAAEEGSGFEAACIAGMLQGLGVRVEVKGHSEDLWRKARREAERLEVRWLERVPGAIRLGPELQLSLLIDIDELCAGLHWLGVMPTQVRVELEAVVEAIRQNSGEFAGCRRFAQTHLKAYGEASFRTPALAAWEAVFTPVDLQMAS